MITVGLINELLFISSAVGSVVSCTVGCKLTTDRIFVQVKNKILDVWYLGNHIWSEKLEDADSMFGVESVSEISRIVFLLDRNDPSWKTFCFFE